MNLTDDLCLSPTKAKLPSKSQVLATLRPGLCVELEASQAKAPCKIRRSPPVLSILRFASPPFGPLAMGYEDVDGFIEHAQHGFY